jgi:PAS domain S-box-containing protein
MSLRQRIYINKIITIVVILAIVVLVAVQYQTHLSALSKESIIQDLAHELVTLSLVTNDYLTFLNESSQAQWQEQFNEMQTLIQQNGEIDSALAPHFASIEQEFGSLVDLARSTDEDETSAERQVVLRHASLSFYQSLQETASELDGFQNQIQTELLRTQRVALIATILLGLLLASIVLIVANSYIRLIIHPLNQLMKGVTELESGNFNHSLPIDDGRGTIQSTNELGQLAVAFNRMAKQLQLTLADFQQELATNLAITDRLRASENQFRTIFNIASLGIAQADPATRRLLAVNDGYQSITGYTTEELLSMTIQDITHPDDREADWERFSRAMREDDSYTTEKRYVCKDGTTIWVRLNVAFIRNDTGEAISTVAICEDISDRKRAEEKLRKSESLLRETQKLAHIGGWEWDIAEQKMYWSDETYRIHGFTEEEIESGSPELIQRSAACYEPDDRPVILTAFEKCITDGISYSLEFPFTTLKGERKWILTMASPVWDQNKIVSVRGNIIDITEQHEAANALREREQLLSEILDTDPTMVYLVDHDGRVVMANQAMADIYKTPLDQLIGKTLHDFATMGLISQANADAFLHHDRLVIETQEKLFTHEESAQLADGSTVWCQTLLTPFNQTDKPPLALGVSVDITARKQAEDSLRESEEKMRSIFRVAPTGIGMVKDRMIMEVNPHICEMTGYTKEELTGQNARLLYPTQQDYDFVGTEKYRQIAAGGTGEVETRWVTKEGAIIDILLASTPLDVDDLSKGVTFTALDITERKKAEEYIRNMNDVLEDMVQNRTEELQKANEELRSFAYSISHDLRAPLRAIDGFSRIVMDEYAEQLTADARRYLNLCRENAITMSNLIEGLLAYSRTGHQAIHLQMVEPDTLVRTVLADLRHEYPEHPAQVSIEHLPACLADPILLKQVYQNLLQNAFKFTSAKPASQIKIGCDKMRGQTVYYVKDNGVGFDMRYADRLFGVFQRLHRASEFEGTGIGLAIVQRIIHRLGGEVWCEADVDKGATFFFTINPAQGLTHE